VLTCVTAAVASLAPISTSMLGRPAATGGLAKVSAPFTIDDWRVQDRAARSPVWKRAIYRIARPLLDTAARPRLSPAALMRWQPEWVLGGRGFPLEHRISWGIQGVALPDARVLVQGTGTGWEVLYWAQLRPKQIVATDLYPFEESWEAISRYCRDRYRVKVEFRAAPLDRHGFLDSGSIDVCVSHGVFEHCRDLPAVLAEARRLLRRSGLQFSVFGPLWYAPGGDHFSSRAGLEHVYAHIELEPDEYREFFLKHRMAQEDFQSGGRYVELDLFSKLTADEYLAAFAAARFSVVGLVAHIQQLAVDYERAFPERWAALLARISGKASVDDLRLTALCVRMLAG
jgi:SAM-dependent methyltransferase